uniref:Uncharacterized protein n=1 Tax=Xenopus tropicalis TaxID=8364 RepID=A0A1B8XW36_XENTR
MLQGTLPIGAARVGLSRSRVIVDCLGGTPLCIGGWAGRLCLCSLETVQRGVALKTPCRRIDVIGTCGPSMRIALSLFIYVWL